MKENFQQSLALVLISEGGFSDDPKDPGGATMEGITQNEYDHWRAEQGLPRRLVQQINSYEVSKIYWSDYWGPCHCDELPFGIDYCVFDFGVNSGPGRAIRSLQRTVRVKDDGLFGNVTRTALNGSNTDDVIEKICADRLGYMQRLPTWEHFKDGWTHRVNSVELKALGMVKPSQPDAIGAKYDRNL